MTPDLPRVPADRFARNEARLAIAVGDRLGVSVEVAITSRGLLAIGGLVAMVLLSTAVIVTAARH